MINELFVIPEYLIGYVHGILLLGCLTSVSCGAGSMSLRNVDAVADISSFESSEINTLESAETTIRDYTVNFKVPNPFIGNRISARRIDPNHEDTIYCQAILLNDISTEADIMYHCFKDSLDAEACNSFREKYIKDKCREGMFRIRISMESGFSPKSMEPEHWIIYIENTKGIMIEPADIVTTPVTSHKDSIYSEYHRIKLPRHLLKRDIALYFNRTTFFGEDLFGDENPYIVLVITREKKTITRIAWKTSKILKK